ncbi:MAG: FHA domain-containing protein [Lachnospiraceae bacterium]|nr:FHA domain-containing protein [Lachnospiraceae bacterium]
MRSFNFKAKIIGEEKYLTYIMGEETELDEDVLDYCQENDLKELVSIIYEEDDDYDYLTYDITGKVTADELSKKEMKCEKVLLILRNIANGLISLKEQAVKLNYILLNRQFMYVDDNCDVQFICLPVESEGSLAAEFKAFVRQFLANLRYDVDEDLNYVGKLLTYINGDNFNLRGLVGLTEALMEESGVSFEEAGGIDADGVEVMNSEDVSAEDDSVKSFMDSLAEEDDTPLPEIGDDEEDDEELIDNSGDEELDSILPAGMKLAEEEMEEEITTPLEDVEEAPAAAKATPEVENVPDAEESKEKVKDEIPQAAATTVPEKPVIKETDEEVLKNRIKALAGDNTTKPSLKTNTGNIFENEQEMDAFLESKPPVIKKNSVKVNRAAIIQNIAASEEDNTANGAQELETKKGERAVPTIEEISDDMNVERKKPKSNSVLSKTVESMTKAPSNNMVNIAKAIPYLIRVNTEERIMLSKAVFKIGKATRGVDYTVSGNGAISRQHAVILRKDDVSYIKDNKSTNHTYVNGKEVGDGEEAILTHDSMIRLGDEEFIFKIR